MKPGASLALAGLSLGLALSTPVLAEPGTLDKIKASGSITLGNRDSSIPFSYLDDKQQPIGYAMDLCLKVVDAVKAELKLPSLKVVYQPVTSATRIPLLANGTIDLECGSTTNNAERQKQVSYTITHFVTANRFVAKKADKLHKLEDLKGKTVTSTSGTTNIKQITELNAARNLGLTILPAKDHAEGFLMVETGRAAAFVMDDILLAGLVANAQNAGGYTISDDALSVEPYGIMVRKDDPAFKKVVDDAMTKIYKSGQLSAIYDKWFVKAIPPRGITLSIPMSAAMKKVVAHPTDTADPAFYAN
ncbi:amino acid ABC transporter substrate-binding protein [Propionivibrio dicarboxylicus]|uniref:Amino acid ABC transporter substrate-binding protein, PAAT family n=1 Tax=Propionivibrio dicarboxylicus TaxID=83767 RepID=A0A1G8BQ90_9RHOO|nr:amino acid ABC transporter substrate-binding protein [Propionivibrio dicarboxylicus]SDH35283.1 amino acid ABC transporter substrate-binding protein, PAAT family [Propionivibrio dicarboxylicus]